MIKIEDILEDKIDFTVLEKMFSEPYHCSMWINSKEDMVIINFPNSYGGIPIYTSEDGGILISFNDDEVFIIGVFFKGIMKNIMKFIIK
jgi:hypothetical protein